MAFDSNGEGKGINIQYSIEDKPPLVKSIPLGAQHVLVMIAGNITSALIILGALGLPSGEVTNILQMVLLISGVATIVQAYSVGPVGARLPIVMGTSFAFIAPIIDIGNTWGMGAVFGAVILAAPVEIIVGYFIKELRFIFPPLVTGVVVILIGLGLIPSGMDLAAGGAGSDGYGNLVNLGVAGLVIVISLAFGLFLKGFLKIAAVLVAIVVGYIVSIPAGLVSFSPIVEAGWIGFASPLSYGLEFPIAGVVVIAFIYIVGAIETIGDIAGTTEAVGRQPTAEEYKGGLIADGVMSMVAGLFNAFPNTSYSQNVGLISFTGVASRHIVAVGGVFLFLLGLSPKFGAVIATIPDPVVGGAGLVVFGLICAVGLRILHRGMTFNQRNMTIVGLSVAIGLAVELRPEALEALPQDAQVILGSGLLIGGFAAILLNQIVPGREKLAALSDDPASSEVPSPEK